MILDSRISTRRLAGLSRRLAIALNAGLELRSVIAREAQRALGGADRRMLRSVSEALSEGESMADALAATGDYFPPLFREVVEVGEQTGHLGEALAQLADHYEGQVALQRTFLSSIAWPMIELTIALVVVGLLIWIQGILGRSPGTQFDMLGFGLVGTKGLVIYLLIVLGIGVVLGFVIHALRRGLLWTRPIQRLLVRLPGLGPVLRTLALARLAWSLNLTFNAGMEVRRALKLSLRNTRNAWYIDHAAEIDASIEAGQSIHEAFLQTGVFPPDFLETLATGEESGTLVETMGRLSKQYEAHAQSALKVLTMLAGLAVWGVVAAILIALIFRLFSFYLGAIQGATKI